MGDYDRSSKWLIEHHGDALLRLAGVTDVVSWRPRPAEVVQPAQLPDGLLEVIRAGEEEPELYVLEIATYPERRVVDQAERDTLLVRLNDRTTAEVVVLVLHPKGTYQIPDTLLLRSRSGRTQLALKWTVVELWTVPAEELLASRDPGLAPWTPLAQYEGPPEMLFRRCREIIDREAEPQERETLLAVTQVLARLRFNDPRLFQLLGGDRAMIESPLLDEVMERWTAQRTTEIRAETRAKTQAEAVLTILHERFGPLPEEDETRLRGLRDPAALDGLLLPALRCDSLEAFRAQIPTPASEER